MMRETKAEKVERLIRAEFERLDMPASNLELYPAQGHWRSSKLADVYRFEGWVRIYGLTFSQPVNSWDTMTDCVRYGVSLAFDERCDCWMVSAKSPKEPANTAKLIPIIHSPDFSS